MSSLPRTLIFGLLLALIAGPGWAVDSQLFTATVPLAEESPEARRRGFEAAMDVILTRITGRLDAPGDPRVADLRETAESYVQQYRMTGDGFWVAFDGQAVETALAQRDMRIWGGERPPVLLVLAVDEGGGRRYILSAEDEIRQPASRDLRARMRGLADLRGLPMLLPLMDAQDRRRMSINDAWGGFEQPLLETGQRYGVAAVLLGRYRLDSPFRVRWALFEDGQALRWDGGIDDGINRSSDRFAARYSVATGAAVEGEIGIAVSGIRSLEDFARVSDYLGGLTAIDSMAPRRLDGDTAVFGVRLRGSLDNVDRAIRLGGLLRPDETPIPPGPEVGTTAEGDNEIRRVALSYQLRQ
ncbi:MAG: DUF2066 domain-containing protein [Gammaproteobacteria bacterium]